MLLLFICTVCKTALIYANTKVIWWARNVILLSWVKPPKLYNSVKVSFFNWEMLFFLTFPHPSFFTKFLILTIFLSISSWSAFLYKDVPGVEGVRVSYIAGVPWNPLDECCVPAWTSVHTPDIRFYETKRKEIVQRAMPQLPSIFASFGACFASTRWTHCDFSPQLPHRVLRLPTSWNKQP